jgi:hypothetical protein
MKRQNLNQIRAWPAIGIVALALVLAMGPASRAMADPYRHTISIDGINDFNAGEVFQTTSTGYTSYITWDDDHLFMGYEGPDVGSSQGRWLLVYLRGVGGTTSGVQYNTQQPNLPFAGKYHLAWKCDGSDQTFKEWSGSWQDVTDPSVVAWSGDFVELTLPWSALGGLEGLALVACIINETSGVEWTYAGSPWDCFFDGYDPDYASYHAFDLSSSSSPNGQFTTAGVHVDAEPDSLNAPWLLTGPGSFALASAGDTTLVDLEPGEYSIVWGDVFGWVTPPPETRSVVAGSVTDFYGIYSIFEGAIITGIEDIANDQGRQVRIRWRRCVHDDPTKPIVITGYEISRRQDSAKLDGWDYVVTVPAHGDEFYQHVVPTLCDSTLTDGMCWSVFFIRAATPDPYVYFDSAPDSGYSLDNLAPAVPGDLHFATANVLAWADPVDADFHHFSVYGSTLDHLDETAVLIAQTTGTSLDVSHAAHAFYLVTATDFAGNEGEETSLEAVLSTTGMAPPRYALHACCPNPFNPRTTIYFDLPEEARVSLWIFDAAGRTVRRLLQEDTVTAGRHSAVWNGRDDAGRQVAAGVYFCRLRAGTFRQTRPMTLLK